MTKKQSFHGEDCRPGKAHNKDRNYVTALQTLKVHYFSGEDSLYNENDFECCFWIKKAIFNILFQELQGCDPFVQKRLNWKG